MKIYLEEKIGDPELFSGRKKELTFFLTWIDRIKKRLSPSTALLSRRKTGKTALLQRLYNITFEKNDNVIPFYYEIGEERVWSVDFCKDFFLTFVYQYMAFKTRKVEYLKSAKFMGFKEAIKITKKEGFNYLADLTESVMELVQNENLGNLWTVVREAPLTMAITQGEFIVQIIDEFQYLNDKIYRDKELTNKDFTFPGGYMKTAEYKNAPLLISGSWVGWLRNLLISMLPGRFRQIFFENLSESESIETVLNYSQIFDIPVTFETAVTIAQLSEGNPFYISSMFYSSSLDKDFTKQEDILKTIEYETLNDLGIIKNIWMEYIRSVFGRVNKTNSKNIVLYLSKHKERQVSRKELLEKLNLEISDFELEQKLYSLIKADIIENGRSNFYYQGVQDNIFDKVFRGVYADDIAIFDPKEITNEYKELYIKLQKKYYKLMGKDNYNKGMYAEFFIINQLRYKTYKNNSLFQSFTNNLPDDFKFIEYSKVWSYKTSIADKRDVNIDIFAEIDSENNNDYSLICEIKNRKKKFSKKEAVEFSLKMKKLIETENIKKSVGFVFSITGFTADALEFFKESGFAYSDDGRWLGELNYM